MNYRNARGIIPARLLAELQKYASGQIIYIPKSGKEKWGAKNGSRKKYASRNERIRSEKESGKSISQLAETYFLSPESIKKIVYEQKEKIYKAVSP